MVNCERIETAVHAGRDCVLDRCGDGRIFSRARREGIHGLTNVSTESNSLAVVGFVESLSRIRIPW